MKIKKKRKLAAPCGLFCGACMIYLANKRGDTAFLTQLKEQFRAMLSNLEPGQLPPGMPATKKNFDSGQLQKALQDEKGMWCCEGCLSDMLALPCRICGLRECAQEKGLTNCSQCADMPCQQSIDFNNDGLPHHAEVLANLKRQKEIGIDAWIDEQEEKWHCAKCGSPIGWYDTECPNCHVTQKQASNFSPFSG